MVYHIGLSKRKQTVVIEACRNVDFLSCEIYDYLGQRITTKTKIKARRYEFLTWLKTWKPDVYGDCRYIVVS